MDTPALASIATHPWAYPVLESLHIAGVALLVGSLVILEMRIWGFARTLPLGPLARLTLGTGLAGFGLLVVTGSLMFAAAPAELLANRVFALKVVLIALAGLNAAWFHARDGLGRLDRLAQVQTVVSLGLWAAVIVCGRWIAYV